MAIPAWWRPWNGTSVICRRRRLRVLLVVADRRGDAGTDSQRGAAGRHLKQPAPGYTGHFKTTAVTRDSGSATASTRAASARISAWVSSV